MDYYDVRGCGTKTRFLTPEQAHQAKGYLLVKNALEVGGRENDERLGVYECSACGWWHIGHDWSNREATTV